MKALGRGIAITVYEVLTRDQMASAVDAARVTKPHARVSCFTMTG
jgi:hypothetical protein